MDNCKRCPQCFKVPILFIDHDGIWLECKKHGHMAMGFTLDAAVHNWNHYLELIGAPHYL